MSLPIFILWACLLGATATFFAGLLGMGGGVLIIPGLVAIFHAQGVPYAHIMHLALGTSLATVVFVSLIAMRAHLKRIKIMWHIVFSMVPGLVVGGVLGAYLASILKTDWLMVIFGTFLAYIGLRFLFNNHDIDVTRPVSKLLLLCLGALIGILASLMGLGGGVFIVPLLKRYIANMREVVALSAISLIPVSFVSALTYMTLGWNVPDLPKYSLGYIYLPAVLVLVSMSFIFTPIGVKLVHTLPQKNIKKAFGVFLCFISVSMFYAAFTG